MSHANGMKQCVIDYIRNRQFYGSDVTDQDIARHYSNTFLHRRLELMFALDHLKREIKEALPNWLQRLVF